MSCFTKGILRSVMLVGETRGVEYASSANTEIGCILKIMILFFPLFSIILLDYHMWTLNRLTRLKVSFSFLRSDKVSKLIARWKGPDFSTLFFGNTIHFVRALIHRHSFFSKCLFVETLFFGNVYWQLHSLLSKCSLTGVYMAAFPHF